MEPLYVDCPHCNIPVFADTEELFGNHIKGCSDRPMAAGDLVELRQQVTEIHQFCANLAEALKGLEQNPMLRTMLGL